MLGTITAFLGAAIPSFWLILAAGLTAFIAWYGSRLPNFAGRMWLIACHIAASWWTLAAALEFIVPAPAAKLFWAEMAWLGIVGTPTYWVLFIWTYIDGAPLRLLARRRWTTLVVPILTWLVALTNDRHHLMYRSAVPQDGTPGAQLFYTHGAWFYGVETYLYALMLMSLVAVIAAIRHGPALYRHHALSMLIIMLVPWIADICYLTGTLYFFGVDPTPFSFLFEGMATLWLIRRHRLFDVLPVAQSTLLDVLPDPVLVLDTETQIVEANAATRALTDPMPAIGRFLADFPALDRAVRPLLALPAALGEFAHRERQFEIKPVPLAHGSRPVGTLLLFSDVTLRSQALARQEQRTRQVTQRAEEQRRLVSMLSHEVRTPLASMVSAAQMIGEHLKVQQQGLAASTAVTERLDRICRLAFRLSALADSFLTDRPDDDGLPGADDSATAHAIAVHRRAVTRAELAARILDPFADQVERLAVTVVAAADRLFLDPDLTATLIANVIGNALKYSPVPNTVDVVFDGNDRELIMTVADRGPGMSAEETALVTRPYFRGAAAAGRPGSGLGLYIASESVKAQGGTLSFTARTGGGTVVTVTLPTPRPPVESMDIPAADPAPARALR